MADQGMRQRLAALLAADVAGYSRLMATDERATVVALELLRDKKVMAEMRGLIAEKV